MRNQLMMMGGMLALAGVATAGAREYRLNDGDYPDAPSPRRRRQAAPIALPPQEHKEKSSSLKRMLGRKGRA
tara:strand:- start:998 stop:1213 length:216 start_codon:yes stop_codon:yes gene_type:complete